MTIEDEEDERRRVISGDVSEICRQGEDEI